MPNMCTVAFYVLQRLNNSCAIYAIYTVVSAHEFIQKTASANSLSKPPAANLPVFVPGPTCNREEYTGWFFLTGAPKYSK